MNTIKYIVKYYPSDKIPVLSGEISYRAALLIQRNSRFRILNKIHTVRDIKFDIANKSTNSDTKMTIYIHPIFK